MCSMTSLQMTRSKWWSGRESTTSRNVPTSVLSIRPAAAAAAVGFSSIPQYSTPDGTFWRNFPLPHPISRTRVMVGGRKAATSGLSFP